MHRQVTKTGANENQSPGESLLRLGQIARFLLRHGSRIDQVASELDIGSRACLLALAFLSCPDRIKFQALVEGWNLLAIRSYLRRMNPPFPY